MTKKPQPSSLIEIPVINACMCQECSSACYYKPGLFLPGEIENVAKFLNLSVTTLFRRFLKVEKTGRYLAISPAVCHDPRKLVMEDPCGKCVFLEPNGHCRIHAFKPEECRLAHCSMGYDAARDMHREIAAAWEDPEAKRQLHTLLSLCCKEN